MRGTYLAELCKYGHFNDELGSPFINVSFGRAISTKDKGVPLAYEIFYSSRDGTIVPEGTTILRGELYY